MLTQCPQCQTTFRVTSEILHVADGQVRCGRCQTQFDALARLIEEDDAWNVQSARFLGAPLSASSGGPQQAGSQLSSAVRSRVKSGAKSGVESGVGPEAEFLEPSAKAFQEAFQADAPDEFRAGFEQPSSSFPSPAGTPTPAYEIDIGTTHEEITLEGRHIEISGTYKVVDRHGHATQEVREESFEEWAEIDDEDALAQERVWQSDDDARHAGTSERDATDPHPGAERDAADVPEDSGQYRMQTPGGTTQDDTAEAVAGFDAECGDGDVQDGDPLRQPPPARRPPWRDFDEPAVPAEDVDGDLLPMRKPRRRAWLWNMLCLPLILLLAAQALHSNRTMLARHPRIGAPLTQLYAALGMQLQPEWDLHAYEVRQWGIISDPQAPGTLRVRASMRNLANFAQPYPLLKLVLEDRWGDQVRAREFEPAEYLDPGTAPNRLLAPAQQANATIVIVDPGPDAEGFHFDVCLRGAAGPVCAADLPGG